MITLNQVSFNFNQNDNIFDKIDLNILENKFITIIGPGGSGKTTFAKLLAGIIAPSNGEILVDGLDLNSSKNNRHLRQKLAYIGRNSDYNNIFTETLEELTAFGPENFGIPKEEILARINQSLKITGMDKFRYIPVYTLPRGKKQIAALASFLTLKPNYLILDEPTSLLDENDENNFWEIVKKIHESHGIGIIYFSNATFIPDCDDIFYIKNKKIIRISKENPELSKNIPITVHQNKPDPSILLEVKDLAYSLNKNIFSKSKLVLEKINFKISRGELVFVQGNASSGKSTMAKLIANLIEPSSGEINFSSFPSKINKKLFRQKIGLIFQEPENQFLTENIEQEINLGLINFNILEKERTERIEWIFSLFSLNYNYLKKQDMLYFPLADRRKIAAAAAIVLFPEILIIDDILTGLDIKEKNIFLKAFIQYQKQKNCACVIFTSRKPDINQADRYFVLEKGLLVSRES